MNRAYLLIWSEVHSAFIAMAEMARARDKRSGALVLAASERGKIYLRVAHRCRGQHGATARGFYGSGGLTADQPLRGIASRDCRTKVEARLPNKDMGFVRAGERAATQVATFPFARHDTIPARVTFVSNAAAHGDIRG
ncbi:ESPR-type extended signal peptide-containing protein [Pelomicrobium sp.]|jgi:hypothetical protein|uniref:ESPR-type extended signal peptide-containing protein n=1 Tax=Pelomicrobium sp. TaxID=2815319 RepID=UPI002FDE949A